jgi:hypothetical protein
MWVVSCCSQRSSGRHVARRPPVKNLAGVVVEVAAAATTNVMVMAVTVAEEAVAEMHEVTHGNSGKKGWLRWAI